MSSGGTIGSSGASYQVLMSEDAEPLTIGMYHPKAGTRSAGGVSIFIRELLEALPQPGSAYLYTDSDPFPKGEQYTNVDVVETSSLLNEQSFSKIADVDMKLPLQDLVESVAFFTESLFNRIVCHINANVDILFTHGQLDTVLLSNVVNVPVVRIFHGVQRTGSAAKIFEELANPAGVLANSIQTATQLRERLGYEVEGIVWPGVDIEKFSPNTTPAFEHDDVVVLFVGRFIESKGVFDLLEAFADAQPRAHLYLVGRGDTERVTELTAELRIQDSVTVEGVVPHDDLPGYYAACDVFCLPTRSESFGLVNLEAMACGKPVITTTLPGIQEYATHGETGFLVDPGDISHLTTSLEELVTSPDERREFGQTGRRVAERYSWRQSASNLLSHSEELIE